MRKKGICQFCLEEKELMKAHVLTHAFFKKVFKVDKRVHNVSVGDFETLNPVQDDFYDCEILCEPCDNSFGVYEEYFVNFIEGRFSRIKVRSNGILKDNEAYDLELYEGVKHQSLRMFFLITLWRLHISKRKSFAEIDLGDRAGDLYRQIREKNLSSYKEYSVIVLSLEDVKDIRKDSVILPMLAYFEGCKVMMILSMSWLLIYNLEVGKMPYLFKYQLSDSDSFNIIKCNHRIGLGFLNFMTNLPQGTHFPLKLLEEIKRFRLE